MAAKTTNNTKGKKMLLEPAKINSWTTEQCVEVFASMEYLGMGEWHSELCGYLDEEQIELLNWSLAQAYVDEKKGKS